MLRSLFAGVSGLRGHQQMMDVVGNNIANVNTTGFKGSSAVFQDLLSQVLTGATAPTTTVGGTSPAQIGLGSRVSAISTNFSQGALQVTGKSTDVAIQGDGFFIADVGGQQMYTRAGTFEFDGQGNLTLNGAFIQGWSADALTGQIATTDPVGRITLPPGQTSAPVKTNNITLGKILSADAAVGDVLNTVSQVFDTQGTSNEIKFAFTKTGTNAWHIDVTDNTGANIGTSDITFDPATGELASQTPDPLTVQPNPAANWPTPITVGFGAPGTTNALREYAGNTTLTTMSQDGFAAGTLSSFKIGSDGTITGVFSNGITQAVGKLAMASFNNPGGLEKAGGSLFRVTPNSGTAQIGEPGVAGRGSLASGSLEMSNVDLSQEFTNLIIAQRGFQASSKVITTSDDLLQELLSLKR